MTATRTRMDRAERREQLLGIGVRLLASRPLEELTIELLAEEAGVSRGLLYHYFGSLREFQVAVVRSAMADIYTRTAPVAEGDAMTRLLSSLDAYVDYVSESLIGYRSMLRAAAGGDPEFAEMRAETQRALADRIFDDVGALEEAGFADSPQNRLLARSWAALVEDAVLRWLADPAGLARENLLDRLALALGVLLTPQ